MFYLTRKVRSRLEELAKQHSPNEACGVLVNETQVVEILNRSGNPVNSFELSKSDIVDALDHLVVESLAIWHSHPGGGVGPSRVDMQNKAPQLSHLVVTLQENNAVFTWY